VKEVKDSSLIVSIISKAACVSCQVNNSCSISDIEEKEVEISHFTKEYITGQEVTVLFKESKGFVALVWGYIIPFIIVLLTLIVALEITRNELQGGLISLAILIPYYTTLYFFRHRLKKIFTFEVEEIN
jgi:sigma-E factor negative regulatory protein RseC